MNSSMALWYKARDDAHAELPLAKAEVHLNLWRQTAEETDDSNFLDVGLLLTNVAIIESFLLFVPIEIQSLKVEDLSVRLRQGNLLSAVFNEIMSITDEKADGTYSTRDRKGVELTIHSVKIGSDVELEAVATDSGERGTILRFRSELVSRLRSGGQNYLRIRFPLDRTSAKEFSLNTRGKGYAVVSSILSEEFTELRFNEMRNMPPEVLARIDKGRLFQITGAHCFLIRDQSFELVAAHAPMHKMRRMEAKLWDGYLPETLVKTDLSKMMIYHWKKTSGEIDSFITLARYRRQRDNLAFYIFGVVILGAMGSSIASSVAEFEPYGDKIGNPSTFLLLVPCLGIFALFPRVWPGLKQALTAAWRRWT